MQLLLHGRRGRWWPGGIATVGTDRLWEEIGFLAYYLHWPLDEILGLTHDIRRRLLTQVSALNREESGGSGRGSK